MYASKIKQTLLLLILISSVAGQFPIVINTWAFTNSTINAWNVLNDPQRTPLDALIEGCSTCEREQCDGTVGYGGSPDENGETALDAMIMDGETMNIGAVGGLRQVKDAIAVARHVLENTRHTLLIGERATEFAEMMGFKRESLSTPKSKNLWKAWRLKNCQPNFWTQVKPDPVQSCGPYSPLPGDCDLNSLNECSLSKGPEFGKYNHDTIGMIVVDKLGKMFAGTSSNGAIHKIPGRVGDSPIPGSGAYACNEIGAAAATGDGDIMMRFLPSFTAVESLRQGLSPKSAAENALKRIMKYYKNFRGALIVVSKSSEYGAACAGFGKFPFSVYHEGTKGVRVEYVDCLPS